MISQYVHQYRGNVVQYNTETFTATFDGPSKAANCSINLMNAVRDLNIQLAIGIHIKECVVGNCISEEIQDFSSLIDNQFIPNQILLTQTVKNLMVGTSLTFTPFKTIFKTVSGNSFLLFTAAEKQKENTSLNTLKHVEFPQDNTLLENVIQTINAHLSNECFGVDLLCKEVGVSERQLQRKLKEIAQISPNQLISSMRLNLAKEFLLSSQDTISEIAFKTGFSNPSYFSKCFRKEFNISPSDLKD